MIDTPEQFLGDQFFQWVGITLGSALISVPARSWGQQARRLSIATGGTGGVFYVMGGGIANMLTKCLSNTKITAEATAAAVDNCKLIGARKADMAFSPGDVLYDGYVGQEEFKSKIPLRTLLIVYSNFIHFVASEGSGIKSLPDLRGKRVSLGALREWNGGEGGPDFEPLGSTRQRTLNGIG